jgi:multimeric flavodoxin WrbA
MKVVGISGSARKDGNTALLIRTVFEPLREAGIECELVELAGKRVHGCTACYKCAQERGGNCVGVKDDANEVIAKMVDADGIILGSPTYYADLSAEMKALIDRAGMSTSQGGGLLKRKVGAAVVAVRRGGGIHVFDSINHLFFITQMIVPGSSYWNIAYGREPGEVGADEEGMRTMRTLGENMAWLLGKLHA